MIQLLILLGTGMAAIAVSARIFALIRPPRAPEAAPRALRRRAG
jgi:hypothetical protein